MKATMVFVCIAIFIIPYAISPSYGNDWIPVTSGYSFGSLGDEVHDASIIARVHLTTRVPVTDPRLSSDHPCGYVFHAVVIDSLKGNSSNFNFFSSVESDFKGFDRDYLVFATNQKRYRLYQSFKSLFSTRASNDKPKLLCANDADYIIPAEPQLLMPFDPEASKLFGGTWLANPERGGISWCVVDISQKQRGFMVVREKTFGNAATRVINWNGARMLILSAVRRWQLFGPRPVEPC